MKRIIIIFSIIFICLLLFVGYNPFFTLFLLGRGLELIRVYPENSPEFFLIHQSLPELHYGTVEEYFVIANAPNLRKIKKAVEEYNLRTIPFDEVKNGISYRRYFYYESSTLTRNFKEGEPYPDYVKTIYNGDTPGQQIRNHDSDWLMTTYYDSSGKWLGKWSVKYEYSYKKIIGRNAEGEDIIRDIDAFISGPPEIFLIDTNIDTAESSIYEDFVIANAPKAPEEIRRVIEDYNRRTIPLDKLKELGDLHRKFYCETELLTRNFKEGEPYLNGGIEGGFFDGMVVFSGERQELRNHNDALLAKTWYGIRIDKIWIYTYAYTNDKKNKGWISQDIYIGDIDAYFAGDSQNIIRIGKKE